MDRAKVISIISGKGGTGKTLMTAVLGRTLSKEGFKVLIVDLDIYVRGLTILLSNYIQLNTANEEQVTISKILNEEEVSFGSGLYRFLDCDFIPATNDIGEPFLYNEDIFVSNDYTTTLLQKLLAFSYSKYDVILLDCRAGVDRNIISITQLSDFIISVAEDDDVCLQANTNLINHLRYTEKVKNIFTIINKGRRISTQKDLEEKLTSKFDFNFIGVIPFDMEVMDDFGKERFWYNVFETLYYWGIVKVWNNFAGKTGLRKIKETEQRSFNLIMNPKHGRLLPLQRLTRIYAVTFTLIGFILTFFYLLKSKMDINLVLIIVSFLASCIFFIISTSNIRSLILGDSDNPKKKTPKYRE